MANGKFQSVEVIDPYRIKFTFTPGTSFRDMPAQAGGTTVFSKADYIANKGMSPAEAAQKWIDENEATWKAWMP